MELDGPEMTVRKFVLVCGHEEKLNEKSVLNGDAFEYFSSPDERLSVRETRRSKLYKGTLKSYAIPNSAYIDW